MLDFLFPRMCLGCGRPHSWLCGRCRSRQISPYYQQLCHVCGVESRRSTVHIDCRQSTYLDGVLVATVYSHTMAEIIHRIKYRSEYALANLVVEICLSILITDIDNLKIDVVSYVPTVRKRRWGRGFNQSKLLASRVAKSLKLPLADLLERREYMSSQVGAGAVQRQLNVRNSFRPLPTKRASVEVPNSVLIVDDVMTTGATLEACAKQLRQMGVAKVYALVVARDPSFILINKA